MWQRVSSMVIVVTRFLGLVVVFGGSSCDNIMAASIATFPVVIAAVRRPADKCTH